MMIADDRWQYINGGGRHGLLIEYCGPSEPVSQILGTGQKGWPTAQEERNLNEAVAGMQQQRWMVSGDRRSSMPRT